MRSLYQLENVQLHRSLVKGISKLEPTNIQEIVAADGDREVSWKRVVVVTPSHLRRRSMVYFSSGRVLRVTIWDSYEYFVYGRYGGGLTMLPSGYISPTTKRMKTRRSLVHMAYVLMTAKTKNMCKIYRTVEYDGM